MKTQNYLVAGTLQVSTTGNIDDLDLQGCGVLIFSNASDATLRGLKAGFPGQVVTIRSTGAGNVYLAHQNSGSAAANRLSNYVTSGVTPLAAGVGSATYAYDEVGSRWRLVSHDQGAPITVTFAAGDFTGNGTNSWTVDAGDVLVDTYYLTGRKVSLQFTYNLTSVGGTASNEVWKTLPNGYVVGFTPGV